MADVQLSRIGGEFLCPAQEAAFQAGRLPETRRHARLMFALSTVLNFAFLASDWRFYGEPHFWVAVPARLIVVFASIACFLLAARVSEFRVLQRIMLAWEAIATISIAFLVSSRSDIALFVVLLLPTLFMLVVPTSFRWTVIVAFGSSAILMAAYMLPPPIPATALGLILALSIQIIGLLLSVMRSNRLRRLEWAAAEAQRRANLDLAESKRLVEAMFGAVPVPVVVSTRTGRIASMNEAAIRFFRIPRQDGYAHLTTRDLVPSEGRRRIHAGITAHQKVRNIELPLQTADGHQRQVLLSAGRVDIAGEECVVSSLVDITDRKADEQAVQRAATHDALTGLPNRALFQTTLDTAIVSAAVGASSVGLILLDLDAFKEINDTLGHDAGDTLLIEIARRLSGTVGGKDLVARLGGDEFVIVVADGARHGPDGNRRILAVAQAVFDVLGAPVAVAGRNIQTRASLGLALYPQQAASSAELLTNADLALYAAKGAGRNRAALFEPALRTRIDARVRLNQEFRAALDEGRIVPFYQPKVSFATGRVVGFEALTRWNHAVKGILSPGAFESVFDDAEIGVLLGSNLAEQVVADIAGWLAVGIDPGRVFINLSTAQFADKALAEKLLAVLEQYGVPPERLGVEVTETVLLNGQAERICEVLNALQAAGIRVALDDFGTGYASLTHLKRFPVDEIKIDRSFVSDLTRDANDAAIVTALLRLGRSLGLDVTAEGVETSEQAMFLDLGGCTCAQGYLYSRPMAGRDVPPYLERPEPALPPLLAALPEAAE
ncbi:MULTISPECIES: EAL domain-containing protein [Methylobacterium]|uniref:Diguanylate cyclase n=3 Tax=Pseudomonadota TaxID=1224 RepID=A0ABQ4SXJ0_9HYPH|nr:MULTISPECIES: EAL domain-containing protein [Methylobacterium]PIU05025.1 MAG: GGDEF-domain containing protein [Methylobacterium sp. CG09_land_8_20_14_0_10_71_15]PIU11527.1 MAG: GGDEF-domain containing protein [Methylobacterium sp. CG08_land_8_20_14_0_20_71_15]GBU16597.1 hypothetical protein AwMethylo_08120 [Methylobacterium sp.]GJE07597.1 hypothetical protein AOPFMNJM_2926 [Methylobacterium jeotgali]